MSLRDRFGNPISNSGGMRFGLALLPPDEKPRRKKVASDSFDGKWLGRAGYGGYEMTFVPKVAGLFKLYLWYEEPRAAVIASATSVASCPSTTTPR